ncbi:MAG: hypothetical protein JNL74_14100 [Fibrobacteres bacterium]|nr:hypothetical protein [Fibrobacterota bacterium]
MFKKPYVLPLIALVLLFVLFNVQRKEEAKAKAAGTDTIKVEKAAVVSKPVLLTAFRDPVAQYSLSGWEASNGGRLGHVINLPAKGYAEFDIALAGTPPALSVELFSLNKMKLILAPSGDSIGLEINGQADYRQFNKQYPFRARIEWNDSSAALFVNGRLFVKRDGMKMESGAAVRPFVRHQDDSASVGAKFTCSDFRLYKM